MLLVLSPALRTGHSLSVKVTSHCVLVYWCTTLLTTCCALQSYGRPRILMMTWPPRPRNSCASELLPAAEHSVGVVQCSAERVNLEILIGL